MRSFREFTGPLPPPLRLPVARRLAFDRDLVIAEGQNAEQEGAAKPAEDGAHGHEGEEHQHAAIAFKIRGLEQFGPGQAKPNPERGPAKCAQHQAKKANNKIFMGEMFDSQ